MNILNATEYVHLKMIQLVKNKIKVGPAAAFSTELTVHREWWWF